MSELEENKQKQSQVVDDKESKIEQSDDKKAGVDDAAKKSDKGKQEEEEIDIDLNDEKVQQTATMMQSVFRKKQKK